MGTSGRVPFGLLLIHESASARIGAGSPSRRNYRPVTVRHGAASNGALRNSHRTAGEQPAADSERPGPRRGSVAAAGEARAHEQQPLGAFVCVWRARREI